MHYLHILEANYWEHYKFAKELSFVLPIDHPKRILLEQQLNEMIQKINLMKIKHVDFLREVTVIKPFDQNGHTFIVGQKLDQVQTPIGAKRHWDLIYINFGNDVFGVNLMYVTQDHERQKHKA